MGGEREWVQTVLLIAVAIGITGMNFVAWGAAVLIWVGGHAALVWAAKSDPNAIKLYRRSLKYKTRYAYRARPFGR